jgi:hypothetical protein
MLHPKGRFQRFCADILPLWEHGGSAVARLSLPIPVTMGAWTQEHAANSGSTVDELMTDALRQGALMMGGVALGLWASMSRYGTDLQGNLCPALSGREMAPSPQAYDINVDNGSMAVLHAVHRGDHRGVYDAMCGGLLVMMAAGQFKAAYGDDYNVVLAAPYDTSEALGAGAFTACDGEFYRVPFARNWWAAPPAPAPAP